MNRSVVCVHCGGVVRLETRMDPVGTRLLAHLVELHRERVAFEALPRWTELLEHFRVVPRQAPSVPSIVNV